MRKSNISPTGANTRVIKCLITRIENKGVKREIMVRGGNLYTFDPESRGWSLSRAIWLHEKVTRSYVEKDMKNKGYYL